VREKKAVMRVPSPGCTVTGLVAPKVGPVVEPEWRLTKKVPGRVLAGVASKSARRTKQTEGRLGVNDCPRGCAAAISFKPPSR
jgi:hypothetical protein